MYSVPRKIELKFDMSEYVPEVLELARKSAMLYSQFEVAHVRRGFFSRHGHDKLNWGRIVQRREWLEEFEQCGEMVSTNARSHGDKVKLWRLKTTKRVLTF